MNLLHNKLNKFSKADFQTDVDISKKTSANISMNKKDLVQFNAGTTDLYYGNLDEDDLHWDQFELNKNKFNVQSTYDEIYYTTELNRNKIPEALKIKADIIAKDIIDNTRESDNLHLKEERGLVSQTEKDDDEEDKYSSVIRNN
mgnify:CR=1 FL=1|jgi:PAB1-binding protein PBP1